MIKKILIKDIIYGFDLKLNSRSPAPMTYDTLGYVSDTTYFNIDIDKNDDLKIGDIDNLFNNIHIKRYYPVKIYGEIVSDEFFDGNFIFNSIKSKVNTGIIDFYYYSGTSHHGESVTLKLQDYYLNNN